MEQEILQLMQQTPGTLYSFKEVGRRLDRHRYRENASWARPFLLSLCSQNILQQDNSGYFFFPKKEYG